MAVDVYPPNFNNNHNESKLFLGGLSWDTSEEDIINYFSKYGQILDVTIKYDPVSGHPRGFGFITFASSDCIDNVLRAGPHTLKNKLIDPKRAKSRPISKKVFVGGIDANTSESEIRRHFNKFGKIEGIELPYDRQRGKRREFCFIIFENEEAADVAVKESKQTIDGRSVMSKSSQPQPVAQQQKRMLQTQGQAAANYPNPGMFAYGYDDYAWPDPAATMGAGSSGIPDRRRSKKSNNGNMHGVEPSWNYNFSII
ncbi:LOW QUALITY PROTEIN: heterogeneous nuclear ribonucleoprotein D-like-A [Panonychus citri]|uniref:LOW QUALITY PROTEIN: heterogeneous nuclear ribonucleoprotein D-like-A n=1 Tax=Panonychus citri TaxID=50023 RepID=UPI0023074702|nr:LOW QUALITY PROTEIN: heterogeneous nuclear ribonucleoprotein D-like-A [Panonychus citri]